MPSRRVRSRLTGPATRATARAAGIGEGQLRHRDVARLSRDTYLPRALVGQIPSQLAAALLTAPPGTVASHRTAAALWGVEIPLEDAADQRVDLTVPSTSRAGSRRDRRLHRLDVPSGDVVRRRSFPVTSPARTWRDLAGVLQPGPLLAVTDQLLDRWCERHELEQQLHTRPSGRGSARARTVLPLGDRLAGSPMESLLRWLLHQARLPTPVLQHEVRDGDGRFLGRVDLAWPERKVIVEFDGDVHRDRSVFVADRRRQNALIAAGWVVLRFTSADLLGRPDDVVATIRRALR